MYGFGSKPICFRIGIVTIMGSLQQWDHYQNTGEITDYFLLLLGYEGPPLWSSAVVFNLGYAYPRGYAKTFRGYVKLKYICIYIMFMIHTINN
jgi:hypothetical protein